DGTCLRPCGRPGRTRDCRPSARWPASRTAGRVLWPSRQRGGSRGGGRRARPRRSSRRLEERLDVRGEPAVPFLAEVLVVGTLNVLPADPLPEERLGQIEIAVQC